MTLPATRVNALEQLEILTTLLAGKRGELALLESARRVGWAQSWMSQDATSVSERDRVADFHATQYDSDIIKLKGDIRALEDERVFLLEAIHVLPSSV